MPASHVARTRASVFQVARKKHECTGCVEPIEVGENYVRTSAPLAVRLKHPEVEFWPVFKFHEGCYAREVLRGGPDYLGGKG